MATNRDTNVFRLYRVIEHAFAKPGDIEQVLLWQPGVGMEEDECIIEGALARQLKDKVRKAYHKIQLAYQPGDEIVLIGFSRGAFIARIVAEIIGDIGLPAGGNLDAIFEAYAELPHWADEKETRKEQKTTPKVAAALHVLEAYRLENPSTVRISCLAIFDTVGALGFPSRTHLPQFRFFGFPVETVGPHVDHIFHALSADDRRGAFLPTRVELTVEGIVAGQDLQQCWFGGWHSDVGGGWDVHELASLALIWMAAQLVEQSLVRLDEASLLEIPGTYGDASKGVPGQHGSFTRIQPPSKPWGHGDFWGDLYPLFKLGAKTSRPPIRGTDIVHESVFSPPQVAWRRKVTPKVQDELDKFPHAEPLPLEVQAKESWPPF